MKVASATLCIVQVLLLSPSWDTLLCPWEQSIMVDLSFYSPCHSTSMSVLNMAAIVRYSFLKFFLWSGHPRSTATYFMDTVYRGIWNFSHWNALQSDVSDVMPTIRLVSIIATAALIFPRSHNMCYCLPIGLQLNRFPKVCFASVLRWLSICNALQDAVTVP